MSGQQDLSATAGETTAPPPGIDTATLRTLHAEATGGWQWTPRHASNLWHVQAGDTALFVTGTGQPGEALARGIAAAMNALPELLDEAARAAGTTGGDA